MVRTMVMEQARWFFEHRLEAERPDRVKWYSAVTKYEPLGLPSSTSRKAEVQLHRLRLEDHCLWQVMHRSTAEEWQRKHCRAQDTDLIHYFSACPATVFLIRGPATTPEGIVHRLCRI